MKCKKILAYGTLSLSLLQAVPFNCMAHPLQDEYIQQFGNLTQSVTGLKKIINKLNEAIGERPFHDIGGLSNGELLQKYLWDNYEKFKPYISNIRLENTIPNIPKVTAISNVYSMPTMRNIPNVPNVFATPTMSVMPNVPSAPNIIPFPIIPNRNNLEDTNPKPYSRKAHVDEEFKNRTKGFDPKDSIACQKLKERFGNVTKSELLSVAEAAISLVTKADPQSTIKLDREEKRDIFCLLKWFDKNWYRIGFFVEYINLE